MSTGGNRLVRTADRLRIEVAVGILYASALAGAELLLVGRGPVAGAVAHAALLAIQLNHATIARHEPHARLLFALSLAPLLRLLSLSLPVPGLSPLAWLAMTGTLLLVSVWVCARLLGLTAGRLGLVPTAPGLQLLVAVTGIVNGLAVHRLFAPAPLIRTTDLPLLVVSFVVVVLFVAVAEGLVLRGVILSVAREHLGRIGAVVASGSTGAILYIGTGSVEQLAAFGFLAFVFAWAVERTGSQWGAIAAHALTVYGAWVLWPNLLA